jgi:acetyl esterase/lipase
MSVAKLAGILAVAGIAPASHAAEPMGIPAFMAIPRPTPTAEIRYGEAPTQAIDLFLPDGHGPFPVVVLIHGGCWSQRTAAREQLRHLGEDLARRGIATWSIGYRRADEAGGGYPGTYLDVGNAIDRLRDEAPRHRLDLSRTVLVGHSAGGHLALWAASRDRLPASSVLRVDAPFVPRDVVAIAGVGDLASFAPLIPGVGGPGIGERLVGEPSAERPDVYADISPAAIPAASSRS